jgi:uncharacterized phiE125 gp8 family phage protein
MITPPLSLAEIRSWCRIDVVDDDPVLMGLVRSCTEAIESYCGLALISRTETQRFAGFVTPLTLYRRPLQSVTSITYLDQSGATIALPENAYRLAGAGMASAYATVHPAAGTTWPATLAGPETVTVEATVGYGDSWNDVPEALRHSLLMMVATAYDYRHDIGPSTEVPHASRVMLRHFRPPAAA